MKTVYIYINGINTRPGSSENWTGRAVTWTHLHTPARAEKVEYYAGPVSRAFGQKGRAHKLARTCEFYATDGWRIVVVGHSNGCDVIVDAIRDHALPPVAEIHLVSAACDANCERNGLNAGYIARRFGAMACYIARRDEALHLVKQHPLARMLGYGTMGITGPQQERFPVARFQMDCGHSTWWDDDHFGWTMRKLTVLTEL